MRQRMLPFVHFLEHLVTGGDAKIRGRCFILANDICLMLRHLVQAAAEDRITSAAIWEIVNLLDPAQHFNVGIQASKAQKVACGCLQNCACNMAIAFSMELHEAANAISECPSTERKPNNHHTHKKMDFLADK